jgi:hypothetical protein
MSFSKLVRYQDEGAIHYGDLLKQDTDGFLVKRLTGNLREGFVATNSAPVRVQTVNHLYAQYNRSLAH